MQSPCLSRHVRTLQAWGVSSGHVEEHKGTGLPHFLGHKTVFTDIKRQTRRFRCQDVGSTCRCTAVTSRPLHRLLAV